MARRTLEGCRTLLSGASSGIGRELALQLAAAGAKLVLTARRQTLLAELAENLRAAGRAVETVAGDIAQPGLRTAALAAARRNFGGLDLLIHCAGVSALGRFAEADPQRLRRIMEVNFFAPVELTREALPMLREGTRPMIASVGSILGHRGVPHSSEYCASKFALRGWTESLRAELAGSGIDVLLVSPGTTQTEFFSHLLAGEAPPWPRQRGVSAELVARRTLRAICRGKHEIVVNPRGKLLVWANRLCPRLVDRLMERYG